MSVRKFPHCGMQFFFGSRRNRSLNFLFIVLAFPPCGLREDQDKAGGWHDQTGVPIIVVKRR